MGVALETWFQGASALFTAIAASAAAWAALQVKSANAEERRLRITAHLKAIYDLVSQLALINPNDPKHWQGPFLQLRGEVNLVFHPLPKCEALADADLWKIDEEAYYDLVSDATAEVNAALRAIWKDSDDRGSEGLGQ